MSNGFDAAVAAIIERAKETQNIAEGDYIGEDNLYYCGKCHTRKQTAVHVFGSARIVPCICKCKADAIAREKEEREQREHFDKVKRYRSMGFPESEMANWNFAADDGSNPQMINAMQNYVQHFGQFRQQGKGLLLFGGVGTGKTFLAACAANALIDRGIPALVTNFARIVNTSQGLFEGRQEYFDSLNRFPLLVLDDLFAERQTDYMLETVYNVIDARYRAKLPVIVTTNLTREELMHPADIRYQRIISRLFEMCAVIEVAGHDRRSAALKRDNAATKALLGL
jgi:DNA replication protein DnaC